MNRAELARLLDHSVLKPEATGREILDGARIVRAWNIGQYCVQPGWVKEAAGALQGSALVASVIGFPHGCEPGEVKARAAAIAVRDGAREIDMVIQIGRLKDGDSGAVAEDISAVVKAVPGIGVKAIIEAPGAPPRAGAAVKLVLRPETIDFATGGVEGSIVSRAFLGEKVEYLVECNGVALQVACFGAKPGALPAEGARVRLRLPADGVTLLP